MPKKQTVPGSGVWMVFRVLSLGIVSILLSAACVTALRTDQKLAMAPLLSGGIPGERVLADDFLFLTEFKKKEITTLSDAKQYIADLKTLQSRLEKTAEYVEKLHTTGRQPFTLDIELLGESIETLLRGRPFDRSNQLHPILSDFLLKIRDFPPDQQVALSQELQEVLLISLKPMLWRIQRALTALTTLDAA